MQLQSSHNGFLTFLFSQVLDVLCSLCVCNGVAVRSNQNLITENLLPGRDLLLQTNIINYVTRWVSLYEHTLALCIFSSELKLGYLNSCSDLGICCVILLQHETQHFPWDLWRIHSVQEVVFWGDGRPHRAIHYSPAISPACGLGSDRGLQSLPWWRGRLGRQWGWGWPLLLWLRWA